MPAEAFRQHGDGGDALLAGAHNLEMVEEAEAIGRLKGRRTSLRRAKDDVVAPTQQALGEGLRRGDVDLRPDLGRGALEVGERDGEVDAWLGGSGGI